jgi:uncharacterized membrane protein (DUF2068 family)
MRKTETKSINIKESSQIICEFLLTSLQIQFATGKHMNMILTLGLHVNKTQENNALLKHGHTYHTALKNILKQFITVDLNQSKDDCQRYDIVIPRY